MALKIISLNSKMIMGTVFFIPIGSCTPLAPALGTLARFCVLAGAARTVRMKHRAPLHYLQRIACLLALATWVVLGGLRQVARLLSPVWVCLSLPTQSRRSNARRGCWVLASTGRARPVLAVLPCPLPSGRRLFPAAALGVHDSMTQSRPLGHCIH